MREITGTLDVHWEGVNEVGGARASPTIGSSQRFGGQRVGGAPRSKVRRTYAESDAESV